ncbi:hypothetical protein PsorP6_007780 [Peronosclerospora sorghi]|uniref:Uncharacterized protein n=1 Tax=Peronosclerospora sorghi TaxID=230839 RepID=A0ACC0W8A8_9STRA|nr:hypothetical protein PsorP6_007780 [Peronosclerospora sorghi]
MLTAAVHRAPNVLISCFVADENVIYNDFIGGYEDEFTRNFFDDFTPSQERMCVTTLQGKFAMYSFWCTRFCNMFFSKVCKTPNISKIEEL